MEKGGPPYAADGSLDYAESASELLHYAISYVLSLVAQWKTHSVYFQPSSPNFLVPLSSPPSSLHPHKILHK